MRSNMDWTVNSTDTEHSMTASNDRRVQNSLIIASILLIIPVFSQAQVPVDDDGNVIGQVQSGAEIMAIGDDGIPRLSSIELQELVGPVALYPDDLLAVVLPASAYPLQIAAAARFLEARESDPSLEPDPEWDDAIIALLNYPEVVELLNSDLDWTYRLGEAVVAQQEDVVAAVEAFRDRAYAAGNLKSDSYQTVARNEGTIHITPVAEDVIYVPYYEPARVVTYQPRPAYYYYPRPCPVYYYPYASDYYFDRGYFWGVTTAFTIGWYSDSLNVWHHSYRGHPYFGRRYWDNWWYRRPSINVYNTTYVDNSVVTINRYSQDRFDRGDRWRARNERRDLADHRGFVRGQREEVRRITAERDQARTRTVATRQAEQIRFRDRAVSATRESQRDSIARREAQQRQQRTIPQREQRVAPQREQRTVLQREQRTAPAPRQQYSPPQREQRAAPSQRQRYSPPQREQRTEPPQREQRTAPAPRQQYSPPQREQRAAPQRESRSAPQRESRTERSAPQRESRTAPRRESSSSRGRESGSDKRRSKRREH